MQQCSVFVSSILHEELSAERERAIRTIRSYRFLTPWAFEEEPASAKSLKPSYLERIREAHLVVLLVGADVSPAVLDEFETARTHCKPLFLFVKQPASRTPAANGLLGRADVKYKHFATPDDLARELERALDEHFADLLGTATAQRLITPLAPGVARLTPYQRLHVTPSVPPTGPYDGYDVWAVVDIQEDSVVLRKHTSDQTLSIPYSAIRNVHHVTGNECSRMILDGRLQILTNHRLPEWHFFPEAPGTQEESWLGFSSIVRSDSPRVKDAALALQSLGYSTSFVTIDRVEDLRSRRWLVYYGSDGRYFRLHDSLADAVMMFGN